MTRVIWALVTVLMLAGCASAPSPEAEEPFSQAQVEGMAGPLREQGFVVQADAFADGVVSADEYWGAIQHLRACIEEPGFGFSEPVLNPLTGKTYEFVYNQNGLDEQLAATRFAECEEEFWLPISTAYNSTAELTIEEPLRVAVLDCMENAGQPGNPDGLTMGEIAGSDLDEDETRRMAAAKCAQDEAMRLHPELPSVTVLF